MSATPLPRNLFAAEEPPHRDTIPVLAPAVNEPSADLVSVLEQLLEKARSGELRSMAFVALSVGQTVYHEVRGDDEKVDLYCLVGQLERLKLETLRLLDGQDGD